MKPKNKSKNQAKSSSQFQSTQAQTAKAASKKESNDAKQSQTKPSSAKTRSSSGNGDKLSQTVPNEVKQCQPKSNSAKRSQAVPTGSNNTKRNHTKQISKSGFRFAKCKTGSSPAKTALLEPVTENKPILNNSAEPAPVMCINYSLCSNYRLFCRRFLRELFH